jgi:hypothetical protein
MVMSPARLGPENGLAGEGQQQLHMTDASSYQRGCYIRTIIGRVQLKRKIAGRESLGAWRQDQLNIGKRQS